MEVVVVVVVEEKNILLNVVVCVEERRRGSSGPLDGELASRAIVCDSAEASGRLLL